MKKRTKKILAWIGGIIGALLIAAVVWGYHYAYKPSRLLKAMIDNDRTEVIRLIDEKGYDPSVKMYHIASPFALYIELGNNNPNLEMLNTLANRGINVNETRKNGLTVLHKVVFSGRTDLVKFLLDNGANVNAKTISKKDPSNNATPLDIAVMLYEPDIINLLIAYGGRINAIISQEQNINKAKKCVEQGRCSKKLLEMIH